MTAIFYYDNPDGRRAKMTVIDEPDSHRVRLAIRSDHGQGDLLLYRTYTTRSGARRAMARRGRPWTMYKKTTFDPFRHSRK